MHSFTEQVALSSVLHSIGFTPWLDCSIKGPTVVAKCDDLFYGLIEHTKHKQQAQLRIAWEVILIIWWRSVCFVNKMSLLDCLMLGGGLSMRHPFPIW